MPRRVPPLTCPEMVREITVRGNPGNAEVEEGADVVDDSGFLKSLPRSDARTSGASCNHAVVFQDHGAGIEPGERAIGDPATGEGGVYQRDLGPPMCKVPPDRAPDRTAADHRYLHRCVISGPALRELDSSANSILGNYIS